ncbi:hypothetical protein GCM10022222_47650 [Amycolatopsis ultiminotia]|uniref:Uncharacterized protein n=1 Tax=Amycolatopsis ultiminotia TaxID=543629 RepID=A0ABP6X0P2_9PSEU
MGPAGVRWLGVPGNARVPLVTGRFVLREVFLVRGYVGGHVAGAAVGRSACSRVDGVRARIGLSGAGFACVTVGFRGMRTGFGELRAASRRARLGGSAGRPGPGPVGGWARPSGARFRAAVAGLAAEGGAFPGVTCDDVGHADAAVGVHRAAASGAGCGIGVATGAGGGALVRHSVSSRT